MCRTNSRLTPKADDYVVLIADDKWLAKEKTEAGLAEQEASGGVDRTIDLIWGDQGIGWRDANPV